MSEIPSPHHNIPGREPFVEHTPHPDQPVDMEFYRRRPAGILESSPGRVAWIFDGDVINTYHPYSNDRRSPEERMARYQTTVSELAYLPQLAPEYAVGCYRQIAASEYWESRRAIAELMPNLAAVEPSAAIRFLRRLLRDEQIEVRDAAAQTLLNRISLMKDLRRLTLDQVNPYPRTKRKALGAKAIDNAYLHGPQV